MRQEKIINELRKLIAKDKLIKWHQINPYRGIISIFLEWILIIVNVYFCNKYFNWGFYIFSVIFIGARFLGLGILMHEGVHRLLAKDKKVNDLLAELFCAWPLFISMRSYRIKHLAHHKWLNTDLDPDHVAKSSKNWQFPMRPTYLFRILATQLSGFGIFETLQVMSGSQVKTVKYSSPVWYKLCRILFYVIVVSVFVFFNKGEILLYYWVIPVVTWTQFANRLRRIAEHSGIEDKDPSIQTRTTKHGLITRIFLSPNNIFYHNEHHLFPGVPFYFLPELHKEIMKNTLAKQSVCVAENYLQVYNDVVK